MLLNQASRDGLNGAAQSMRMAPSRAFWSGMKLSGIGIAAGVPMIAYEAGHAQRGEVLPTALGRTVGLMTFPALSGALAAGGAMAATALGLSVPGIGAFAVLASIYPDVMIGNSINRSIRSLTAAGRQVHHLEFGGSFQDTDTARQMRNYALYEMSGATSASRRYLGQEAALMHR
jgi:hypothetical protein